MVIADLELQDVAIRDKFLLQFKGEDVPHVFASPHRSMARLEEVYGEDRRDRPILPAMSFWRQEVSFSGERWRYNPRWPLTVTQDNKIIKVDKYSPWTVDITYQIEIWSPTRAVLNLLSKTLNNFFIADRTSVLVDFGSDWGEKRLSVRLDSLVDNSDLEYGEGGQELRNSMVITLHGVIFGENYEDLKAALTIVTKTGASHEDDYVTDLSGNDDLLDHWKSTSSGVTAYQERLVSLSCSGTVGLGEQNSALRCSGFIL